MIISIIVLVIVVMIGAVLVIPVRLVIDTDKDLYTVYQPGVFSIRMFPLKEFRFEIRIAGVMIPTPKTKRIETRDKLPANKPRRQKHKTRSAAAWRFFIRRIVDSVRVKKFEMDIDTDDFPLNAKLVPLFSIASRNTCVLNINFSGRNYLGVTASLRPIALVMAYVLFLTKQ